MKWPVAVAVALWAVAAAGEIYTWVDEHGKTHYGDRVPPEYQQQVQPVEVAPINSMDPVAPSARSERHPQQLRRRLSSGQRFAPPPAREPAGCEEQMAAYKAAQACYYGCRSLHGINKARCGHCRDMKRPDC